MKSNTRFSVGSKIRIGIQDVKWVGKRKTGITRRLRFSHSSKWLCAALIARWASHRREHSTFFLFDCSFLATRFTFLHLQPAPYTILNTNYALEQVVISVWIAGRAVCAYPLPIRRAMGTNTPLPKLNDQFKFPTYCNNGHGHGMGMHTGTLPRTANRKKNWKINFGIVFSSGSHSTLQYEWEAGQSRKNVKRIARANITF